MLQHEARRSESGGLTAAPLATAGLGLAGLGSARLGSASGVLARPPGRWLASAGHGHAHQHVHQIDVLLVGPPLGPGHDQARRAVQRGQQHQRGEAVREPSRSGHPRPLVSVSSGALSGMAAAGQ